MTTDNGTKSDRRVGSRERWFVCVDLLKCLNKELGWDRATLWEYMQRVGDPDKPDLTVVDKVFQRGWATPPVYRKMETAYKTQLALRHASLDPAIHIDPKKVPMIDHLHDWPSQSLRRRYYSRIRLEEKLKGQWERRQRRKPSSSRKPRKRNWHARQDAAPEDLRHHRPRQKNRRSPRRSKNWE